MPFNPAESTHLSIPLYVVCKAMMRTLDRLREDPTRYLARKTPLVYRGRPLTVSFVGRLCAAGHREVPFDRWRCFAQLDILSKRDADAVRRIEDDHNESMLPCCSITYDRSLVSR